jgi:hypothetical protein
VEGRSWRWSGAGRDDEDAILVAARRTTTLQRYNLPLKTISRDDVGFFFRGIKRFSGGDFFLPGVLSIAVELSLEVVFSCSYSFVYWVSPPRVELHRQRDYRHLSERCKQTGNRLVLISVSSLHVPRKDPRNGRALRWVDGACSACGRYLRLGHECHGWRSLRGD